MVVGIGGIGGSRVGGQSCAGSPLSPSGRSPPCGNADDFAASEADHDGATCSNSAVAAIRNRRGCMPHLQIEQNLTIYKIHSLNEQGNALLFLLLPHGGGRRWGHRAIPLRSRPHTYVQAGEGLQTVDGVTPFLGRGGNI